eukprot:2061939-Rhodomonas_salina.2
MLFGGSQECVALIPKLHQLIFDQLVLFARLRARELLAVRRPNSHGRQVHASPDRIAEKEQVPVLFAEGSDEVGQPVDEADAPVLQRVVCGQEAQRAVHADLETALGGAVSEDVDHCLRKFHLKLHVGDPVLETGCWRAPGRARVPRQRGSPAAS